MKLKVKFFILLVIFFLTGNVFGIKVELVERIKITDGEGFPAKPWSFCVTKDETFIVPDYYEGTLRIYVKSGDSLELVNSIGRKGFRKGDLGKPAYSYYNDTESIFVVLDRGLRKIFIYSRIGAYRLKDKPDREFNCQKLGYDIQLKDDKVFVSGYKKDPNGSPYSLYYIDMKTNETEFLLQHDEKYQGYIEPKDPEDTKYNKILNAKKLVGVKGWSDIYEDNIYFVYEGDIERIIKLNIKTKKISIIFGKKPENKNYKSPKDLSNADIEKLRKERKNDIDRFEKDRGKKFSYVKDIFVNSKNVLLAYNEPTSNKTWLQFYSLDGKYKGETSKLDQPIGSMWFDKSKNFLYLISSKNIESGKEYYIAKYKILE